MNIITQERDIHMAQLEEAARHILPNLGYTSEAIDRFVEKPDPDSDEGECFRIETGPDEAVLARVRGADRWEISYLIPTRWSTRYQAIRSAVEAIIETGKTRGVPNMWLHIKKDLPSHQAYYEGMLPFLDFDVEPRAFMKAPINALDTLEMPELPDDIMEIEVTEDRLREAAASHTEAFRIYDKAPMTSEELQKSVDNEYESFVGWFQNDPESAKTWVALEHQGKIIAICIGLRWRFDTRNLTLHEVALHPDYHGRGLGRYICMRCMQKLREVFGDSDTRFYLGTTLTQTPAIKLYYKLGFTIDKHESYVHYRPARAS